MVLSFNYFRHKENSHLIGIWSSSKIYEIGFHSGKEIYITNLIDLECKHNRGLVAFNFLIFPYRDKGVRTYWRTIKNILKIIFKNLHLFIAEFIFA